MNGDIKVDGYKRSLKSPLLADRASRRTVLRIPELSEGAGHNGGAMKFLGRMLYLTVGDGGNPGDVFNQAQDLESLRGKMLRIDPRFDRASGESYRVPAGNPFSGLPGRDEIFAYGLRNPHGLTIFRGPGNEPRFVITDVGQVRYEEANNLSLGELAGANFGWKMFEGFESYDCGPALCPNGAAPPVAVPSGLTWPELALPAQ